MSDVEFTIHELSSAATDRLLHSGRYDNELPLNTASTPDGEMIYVGAEIPLNSGRGGCRSYFRMELGFRHQNLGGRISWPVLFTHWATCSYTMSRCEDGRGSADRALAQTSVDNNHLRSLPEGVSVWEVRYSRARENIDILVLLTNGASLLISPNNELLNPFICSEW